MSQKSLFLVDGSGFIFRAFFALPRLANSKGLPTGAIYGFAQMLDKLVRDMNPPYLAVCFDVKEKTFRHEMYPAYKANRPEPPEDLVPQFDWIHRLVEAFNVAKLTAPGFEADDIIATLTQKALSEGFDRVVLVTGDKDLYQLVSDKVALYDPRKDIWVHPADVKERYGADPVHVADSLALMGDSADNVPGVPGIGEKTAKKLMEQYGSLDSLSAHLAEISGKLGEILAAHFSDAVFAKSLIKLRHDVPLNITLEQMRYSKPNVQTLSKIYMELEFTQLLVSLSGMESISRENYRLITDEASLKELAGNLARQNKKGFAVDTETTGVDPMKARLVGMSFCCDEKEAFYIPLGHDYLGVPPQVKFEKALEILSPVLADPQIPKTGHNIKYDWIILEREGIQLAGVADDTMVASYVLNPGRKSHGLDALSREILGHATITYEDVCGKGKTQKTFNEVDLKSACDYAAEDAHVTWLLRNRLIKELVASDLDNLYRQLEVPLIEVLARMEMNGVKVDIPFLRKLSKEMTEELTDLTNRIHEMAGTPFNLNSPKQLAEVLFDRMKLNPVKRTKSGQSTDVSVLEVLAKKHPFPGMILDYRTIFKLKNTYVDALISIVHPQTGRIHTSFNQTVTATGRLSSSEPNLQNIPIRTEQGRRIRRAFVPENGYSLIVGDYSQVELRLFAHEADDENMIESFLRGEDIHKRTASEVLNKSIDEITDEDRRLAKTINFGILYGMSAFGLAQQLDISRTQAQAYIDTHFARYPKVRKWLDETIAKARADGWVMTPFGRRRFLPEINSSDPIQRAAAERTAINTPIQGGAADLIKMVMLSLHRRIAQEKLPYKMILQVHDELVLEVPDSEMEKAVKFIRHEMESVADLKAPLKVDIGVGKNWAEAH